MRFDLKVPFAEKDAAKKLGARWDAGAKVWYVTDRDDMTAFAGWSPVLRESASAPAHRKPVPARAGGKLHVGTAYLPMPRACTCLPWAVCELCCATALPNP